MNLRQNAVSLWHGGILLVGSLVSVVDGAGQFLAAPACTLLKTLLLYTKLAVALHIGRPCGLNHKN